MVESSTNSQTQSPLFKLALEIRLQIYQEVIRLGWTERIHIVPEHLIRYNAPERSTYVPCTRPPEAPHQSGISRYGHDSACHISFESQKKRSAPARENSNISLFLVCRQISSEALPLLYSTPTFSFSEFSHATTFLSSLPPHLRNSIQKLHISGQPEQEYIFQDLDIRDTHTMGEEMLLEMPGYPTFQNLCSTLAKLPNLRELRIFLDHARIKEVDLFTPLRRVKRTGRSEGVFIVRIPRAKQYSAPRDSYATIDTLTASDLSRMGVEAVEDGSQPFVFDGVVMPFRVDRRQWPDENWGSWNKRNNEIVDQAIVHGHPRRKWKWRILCMPCFCVAFPFKLFHDHWEKRRAAS